MTSYEQKRRFFDEAAPLWERGEFDHEELTVAGRIIQLAELQPGMTVLEPGCGAGRMTRLLAEAVTPSGTVIAVDMSEKMVAAARRRASAEHVIIRQETVEETDLPPGSVDVVLCFDVFPHFEQPGRVLDKLRSILKPQGKLIVAHCPGRRAVNEIHKRAGGAVGADRLPTARKMKALFAQHGFPVTRLVDEPHIYYLQATPSCT